MCRRRRAPPWGLRQAAPERAQSRQEVSRFARPPFRGSRGTSDRFTKMTLGSRAEVSSSEDSARESALRPLQRAPRTGRHRGEEPICSTCSEAARERLRETGSGTRDGFARLTRGLEAPVSFSRKAVPGANSSITRGRTDFHAFGCRQNGGVTADTIFLPGWNTQATTTWFPRNREVICVPKSDQSSPDANSGIYVTASSRMEKMI